MQIVYTFLTLLYLLCCNYLQDDKALFNGQTLDGWQVIDFTGHGDIDIADSCIIIRKGEGVSGIKWAGDFPKTGYELSLEAKLIEGSDIFCGITVPVEESFITLVIGGWGGSVVGLSCIDGYDASENETYTLINFNPDQWYPVRLKTTEEKIEAWIDNQKIIDFTIDSHDLYLRWEAESSKPFGIFTYGTTGALKNIFLKMTAE